MSVAILTDLRDAIIADAAINEQITTRYNKSLSHLIGYEKGSPNAANRPMICYVDGQTIYAEDLSANNSQASVVLQVIDKATTDGVRDGVASCDAIATLLVELLNEQPLQYAYFNNVRTITDMGIQHPFYEIEISFNYSHGL
jgi:hypothetical protein